VAQLPAFAAELDSVVAADQSTTAAEAYGLELIYDAMSVPGRDDNSR
jgi:hypothetical protein